MADYQHYQLRIHRSYSDVVELVESLYKKAESGFIFQHPPDDKVSRLHVHCYYFNIALKYDAIRERCLKFGLKGNSDFAISGTAGEDRRPLDVSGAWCYGTKREELPVVFAKNISPATVEELKEYSRRFYAKWATNTPTGKSAEPVKEPVKKSKQLTKYEHVRAIVSELLSPEFVKMSKSDPERIAIVRDVTLEYLRKNGIFSGMYRAVEWIETVLNDLGDETFKQSVTIRLEKNLGIIIPS